MVISRSRTVNISSRITVVRSDLRACFLIAPNRTTELKVREVTTRIRLNIKREMWWEREEDWNDVASTLNIANWEGAVLVVV